MKDGDTEATLDAIMDCLRGRKGFLFWWDGISGDIQLEILDELGVLVDHSGGNERIAALEAENRELRDELTSAEVGECEALEHLGRLSDRLGEECDECDREAWREVRAWRERWDALLRHPCGLPRWVRDEMDRLERETEAPTTCTPSNSYEPRPDWCGACPEAPCAKLEKYVAEGKTR